MQRKHSQSERSSANKSLKSANKENQNRNAHVLHKRNISGDQRVVLKPSKECLVNDKAEHQRKKVLSYRNITEGTEKVNIMPHQSSQANRKNIQSNNLPPRPIKVIKVNLKPSQGIKMKDPKKNMEIIQEIYGHSQMSYDKHKRSQSRRNLSFKEILQEQATQRNKQQIGNNSDSSQKNQFTGNQSKQIFKPKVKVLDESNAIPVKLVTVGDACVGKTSMLISYTTNQFPNDHVPTIFQSYAADVVCDSRKISLCLWDTAGQEQYRRIRVLSYPKTDIFLICFSMVDHQSFYNALNKWLPQIDEEWPKAFKIFVGTKSDIHAQYQDDYVHKHQAVPLAIIERQVGMRKCSFMPCNSLTQKGLNQIFTTAIRKVVKKNEQMKKQPQFQCQII